MMSAPLPHPSPHGRCRRSNRETIEAELFNLRSCRKGFVKSESLRLTSPRHSNNEDDERSSRSSRGRRWRRQRWDNGEGNGIIEKFREAARRAKVLELRLVGRRSWWPQFDGKRSRVAALESPTKSGLPTNNDVDRTKKERCKQSKKAADGALIVNFPTEHRKSSPSKVYPKRLKFWWTKEKSIEANDDQIVGESNMNMQIRRRSAVAKKVVCSTDKALHIEHSTKTTPIKSEDTVEQKIVDLRNINDDNKEEANERKKKKRVPVVAVTAAASLSSLGIAAAIILL